MGQDLRFDKLEAWSAPVRPRLFPRIKQRAGREQPGVERLELCGYRTSNAFSPSVFSFPCQLTRCGGIPKATASCAIGRADVVGRFFDRITTTATPEESRRIFLRIREAITIVYPFLGIPTCIPACYGMIGVVERKGQEYGETKVLRKQIIDDEDVRKGKELRARIYSGVGNSGIFALMDKYFTDLCESFQAIKYEI
jgi:hypothetical protein